VASVHRFGEISEPVPRLSAGRASKASGPAPRLHLTRLCWPGRQPGHARDVICIADLPQCCQ
jgi:hypothetical protein